MKKKDYSEWIKKRNWRYIKTEVRWVSDSNYDE